jgi:hypothetical protein
MSNEPTATVLPQTLAQLAEQYGGAIGDVLPRDTNFVLLVYRPGNAEDMAAHRAGIAYVTSSEAPEAVRVVRGFLAMIDASRG